MNRSNFRLKSGLIERCLRSIRNQIDFRLLISLAGMVGVFVVLNWYLIGIAVLSEDAFQSRVIASNIVQNVIRVRFVSTFCLILLLVYFYGRIFVKWSDWENGQTVRVLTVVSAFLLTWSYAVSPFNYYYDKWFLADRLIIGLLFIGIVFRPIFLGPFAVTIVGFASQYMYPIGDYSWAASDLFIHLILGVCSYYLLSLIGAIKDDRILLLFLLSIIAIHFFPSGTKKLMTNWIFENHLEYIVYNARSNGWLLGITLGQLERMFHWIRFFGPLGMAVVVSLECFGIFMILHRRLALFVFAGWMFVHLLVFVVSGILFWQWMTLELLIWLILWRSGENGLDEIFGIKPFLIVGLVVLLSPLWIKTVKLSWFDSAANYTYRIYGYTDKGDRYQLDSAYFAPYDYQFTFGAFHYANMRPAFDISWGATNRNVAKEISAIPDRFAFFEKENNESVLFDEDRTEILKNFLNQFASNRDKKKGFEKSFGAFSAPRLVQNSAVDDGYDFDSSIIRIEMVQVLTYYGDDKFQEIRRLPIFEIAVD